MTTVADPLTITADDMLRGNSPHVEKARQKWLEANISLTVPRRYAFRPSGPVGDNVQWAGYVTQTGTWMAATATTAFRWHRSGTKVARIV